MLSSRQRLAASRLYLILDADVLPYPELWRAAKSAIQGGVDIIQLRDKRGCAKDVLAFSIRLAELARGKALFIVNDRVDIARLSGATGVHLGQDDLSVNDARKILGRTAIVGRSCQTLKHLSLAEREHADYVGFGSVFLTQTKPGRKPMDLGLLGKAVHAARIPIFPIGGIARSNLSVVTGCGVRRVAVCRDILLAANPGRAAREIVTLLDG